MPGKQRKKIEPKSLQVSDYLKSLNDLDMRTLKKKISSIPNCLIHNNNQNIFSFSKNNLKIWTERYMDNSIIKKNKRKKPLQTPNKKPTEPNKDIIMKFIIQTRKEQLKNHL